MEIDVEKVRFSFDKNQWAVAVKWDDHPRHRNALADHGTKAVDIIALFVTAPWLFEMKDVRDHRIPNRGRDYAEEIARKVRDTIASMIWTEGREGFADSKVTRVLKAILAASSQEESVRVVVWIDEDRPMPEPERLALKDKVSEHLNPWINAKVLVTNTASWKGDLGLTAHNHRRSVPGAGDSGR